MSPIFVINLSVILSCNKFNSLQDNDDEFSANHNNVPLHICLVCNFYFYLLGFRWLNTNIMELLFYVPQDLKVLLVVQRFRSAGQNRDWNECVDKYLQSWMCKKWMVVIKYLKPPKNIVSIELSSTRARAHKYII